MGDHEASGRTTENGRYGSAPVEGVNGKAMADVGANGHAGPLVSSHPLFPESAVLFANDGLPYWEPRRCKVSVVIPARNEEKCLPHVLNRLPSWIHEVIVVDGGSTDATCEVAQRHWPTIRIVPQTGTGKGAALREGFLYCTGDVVVAIDADGSMDPGEMGVFVSLLELGFDYVKGSRMLPGGGSTDLTMFRRVGNWIFRTLTNTLHGTRYSDLCYGYFAFRRGTIDALPLTSDDFVIETEINIKACKAGFRMMEVPSFEFNRIHGDSSLKAFADGSRILRQIFRERFVTDRHAPAAGEPLPSPAQSQPQPSMALVDDSESWD